MFDGVAKIKSHVEHFTDEDIPNLEANGKWQPTGMSHIPSWKKKEIEQEREIQNQKQKEELAERLRLAANDAEA